MRLLRLLQVRRRRYIGLHRAQTAHVPPGPQVVLGFRDGTAAELDPDAPVARALQAAASHMRARTS